MPTRPRFDLSFPVFDVMGVDEDEGWIHLDTLNVRYKQVPARGQKRGAPRDLPTEDFAFTTLLGLRPDAASVVDFVRKWGPMTAFNRDEVFPDLLPEQLPEVWGAVVADQKARFGRGQTFSLAEETVVLQTAQAMVTFVANLLGEGAPLTSESWIGWPPLALDWGHAHRFDMVMTLWLRKAHPVVNTRGWALPQERRIDLKTFIASQLLDAWITRAEVKVCELEGCPALVVGRRKGARYCSPRCQSLIGQRRHRAKQNTLLDTLS